MFLSLNYHNFHHLQGKLHKLTGFTISCFPQIPYCKSASISYTIKILANKKYRYNTDNFFNILKKNLFLYIDLGTIKKSLQISFGVGSGKTSKPKNIHFSQFESFYYKNVKYTLLKTKNLSVDACYNKYFSNFDENMC